MWGGGGGDGGERMVVVVVVGGEEWGGGGLMRVFVLAVHLEKRSEFILKCGCAF